VSRGPQGADISEALPDIDENGVDRAQIRAMLKLTPEERLARVEEFALSLIEIRELNGERPLR
jgi:hypothetical protein